MEKIQSEGSEKVSSAVTSFARHYIEPEKKSTMDQITEMVKSKYGKGSRKASDTSFLTSVLDDQERVRKRVFAEASPMITSLFCSLASIAGLVSNDGGSFLFRHIPNNLIATWDLKEMTRYFFIIRASWDDNPDWILNAEKKLME